MNAITPTEPKAADGTDRQDDAPELMVSYEPATGAELWRGRVSDIENGTPCLPGLGSSAAVHSYGTGAALRQRGSQGLRKAS